MAPHFAHPDRDCLFKEEPNKYQVVAIFHRPGHSDDPEREEFTLQRMSRILSAATLCAAAVVAAPPVAAFADGSPSVPAPAAPAAAPNATAASPAASCSLCGDAQLHQYISGSGNLSDIQIANQGNNDCHSFGTGDQAAHSVTNNGYIPSDPNDQHGLTVEMVVYSGLGCPGGASAGGTGVASVNGNGHSVGWNFTPRSYLFTELQSA